MSGVLSAIGRLLLTALLGSAVSGCHLAPAPDPIAIESHGVPTYDLPREQAKALLPSYPLAPPDLLTVRIERPQAADTTALNSHLDTESSTESSTEHSIESSSATSQQPSAEAIYAALSDNSQPRLDRESTSRSSAELRPGDAIRLHVSGTFPDSPIAGTFTLDPYGQVDLGFDYGHVLIGNLSRKEAEAAIREYLYEVVQLKSPQVSLTRLVAESATPQSSRTTHKEAVPRSSENRVLLTGTYRVAPDGTLTLGEYGPLPVVGLTVEETRLLIESVVHVSTPEATVAVALAENRSRFFYVITEGIGRADRVLRLPFTGHDTVLDAVSQLPQLQPIEQLKVWIARPGHNELGGHQILPVDWLAMLKRGEAETNYQLFPGDRLYLQSLQGVRHKPLGWQLKRLLELPGNSSLPQPLGASPHPSEHGLAQADAGGTSMTLTDCPGCTAADASDCTCFPHDFAAGYHAATWAVLPETLEVPQVPPLEPAAVVDRIEVERIPMPDRADENSN